ncbi:MAG: septum formation initiator family protein [Spirochaetales bacterium]|nr:septum formation initiator family protein [Spirochaetales bacterium]
MLKTKLFISLYIGFLVYIALKSFFGAGGFFDYISSVQYKDKLNQNLQELEIIYHDLFHDLKSLKSNAHIVKLYSRELGYFESDEHVIKFQGMGPKKIFYKVGTVLKRNQALKDETQILFISVGFAVFLVIFLFSLILPDKKKRAYGNKKRRSESFIYVSENSIR